MNRSDGKYGICDIVVKCVHCKIAILKVFFLAWGCCGGPVKTDREQENK